MFAALLFATALNDAAGSGAATLAERLKPSAFCRDLQNLIAETDQANEYPFYDFREPPKVRKLTGFDSCRIEHGFRNSPPPPPNRHVSRSVVCSAYSYAPLEQSRLEVIQAIQACTAVAPRPVRTNDETLIGFESDDWMLTIEDIGCDRCVGVPSVVIRIVPLGN